jgi:hypothetical protein
MGSENSSQETKTRALRLAEQIGRLAIMISSFGTVVDLLYECCVGAEENIWTKGGWSDGRKLRRMRWVGHVARMGEKRSVYRLLVGKPGGKRPLGSPSRRWIVNIKIDLLEIGLSVADWIGLAQDRYS